MNSRAPINRTASAGGSVPDAFVLRKTNCFTLAQDGLSRNDTERFPSGVILYSQDNFYLAVKTTLPRVTEVTDEQTGETRQIPNPDVQIAIGLLIADLTPGKAVDTARLAADGWRLAYGRSLAATQSEHVGTLTDDERKAALARFAAAFAPARPADRRTPPAVS